MWPWLAQMGCDRAGWYSWDRLDNGGRASAREIRPEWQQIAIGDHLASSPSGRAGSKWPPWNRSDSSPCARRSISAASRSIPPAPRPRCYVDSLWAFRLDERPEGRTRLVVSGYASSRPRPLTAVGDFLFWEPAHWIMQTRQFTNLKRRVERA